MRIPRFWAVAEGSQTDEHGAGLFRRVWGWSMSSAADALAVAQERLQAVLAARQPGGRVGSYYPRVPLREPILEEVLAGEGSEGEQILVVTRNRYGADILNTDRVVIADIDLAELQEPRRRRRWAFWRASTEDDPAAEPAAVTERLDLLASWAAAHAGLGITAYRTASGLRVFVTGASDPAPSGDGLRILTELDADPVYRELCRAHATYRARLTPKPWRMTGMSAPSGRWPYAEGRPERRFQRWLASYREAAGSYAVCRRLAGFGTAPSGVERQIMQLHDERTRTDASLPLA